MTEDNKSPFVPGARVALRASSNRYGDSHVSEAFVDKVYKTGNFTLRGSKQQWRGSANWGGTWTAHQTGGGYYRASLELWTPKTDSRIRLELAVQHRRGRLSKIKDAIGKLDLRADDVCDDKLAALEAALAMPARSEATDHNQAELKLDQAVAGE